MKINFLYSLAAKCKNKTRFTPTPNEDGRQNRHKQSIIIWCGGFTLWEISIVIGIMALLFSSGLLISTDFYRQKVISAERDTIVTILKRARNEAQNNVNQSGHGVYFGSASNYVIFQGDTYATRNAVFDEPFSKSGGITLSGPSELVFSPLEGNSSVSGTVSISNSVQTLKVSVNSEGRIDW